MQVTLNAEELERFRLSLERCMSDQTFVSRFYARFILTHADVSARFANTDMKRQATVLKSSLYMMLRAALRMQDGYEYLRDVARTHSKKQLDIPPHLYALWLDTLVEVAHETDRSPDRGEIDDLWRRALQPCIDHIVAQR